MSISLSLGSEQMPLAGSPQEAGTPCSRMAGAAAAAELCSPVTLQPLQPDGAAASTDGWWSPGTAHTSKQVAEADADDAGDGGALSPLAAAVGEMPEGAAGSGDANGGSPLSPQTGSTLSPQAVSRRRRRHSSPFLARDCSSVDVFCADRYSAWTRQQRQEGGAHAGSSAAVVGSSSRPQQRWQRFAPSLEAAELGGAEAGEAGRSRGLRRAFSSMLHYLSGRLHSHPIELSPSELGSPGSGCNTPGSSSPLAVQASSRSSPGRFYTPAEVEASGGSAEAAAAGEAAAGGLLRRQLCYESEEEGGSSCGSSASCSPAAPASSSSGGSWRGAGLPLPEEGRVCLERQQLFLPALQLQREAQCSRDCTAMVAQADSSSGEGGLVGEESQYETPRSCRSGEEEACSAGVGAELEQRRCSSGLSLLEAAGDADDGSWLNGGREEPYAHLHQRPTSA